MKVRPPAVADQFHARHPDQLRVEVAELLASTPAYRAVSPKALIVPHAGDVYKRPQSRQEARSSPGGHTVNLLLRAEEAIQ